MSQILGESNLNEIGGSNKSAFENFSPLITPITNYDAQNHLKGRRVHFGNNRENFKFINEKVIF